MSKRSDPPLSELWGRAIPLRNAPRTLVGRFISERLPNDGSGSTEEQGEQWDKAGVSRSSLDEHGVNPAYCFIIENQDESMEPTLPNGCVTMVDGESWDSDSSSIKVVQFGDELMFRRVATTSDGQRLLVSDHADWPDQRWPLGARIVGEVKWVGHWAD